MDTKKLRQKILDLAIRGKLVPQDPNDEPASVLLERIREEKERLIKEGKIKRDKKKEISTSDTSHYRNLPFEVPGSWVWCRLGEIAFLKAGSFVKAEDIKNECQSNLFPCYGGNGLRGYVETFTHEGLFSLIGRQGALCGNINLVRGKFHATEHAIVTSLYCNINSMWMFYTLKALNLNQYSIGAAQPGLSVERINKIFIPLPPFAVQHRIVSVIESAFTFIDQIEESKLSLSQFIKQTKSKVLNLAIRGKLVPQQNPNDEPTNVLLEKIKNEQKTKKVSADISHYPFEVPKGWEWGKLGDVCKQITDGTHRTPSYVEKGICFLRVTDITESNSSKKFISTEEHNELIKRCKPEKGDVLLSKNVTIGVAKVVDWDYDFSIFVSLCLLKPRSIILNSKYLAFYLRSNEAIKQMKSRGKSFTITNLHLEEIKQLQIIVPPLAEQQRIVSKIEQIFVRLEQIENAMYE